MQNSSSRAAQIDLLIVLVWFRFFFEAEKLLERLG